MDSQDISKKFAIKLLFCVCVVIIMKNSSFFWKLSCTHSLTVGCDCIQMKKKRVISSTVHAKSNIRKISLTWRALNFMWRLNDANKWVVIVRRVMDLTFVMETKWNLRKNKQNHNLLSERAALITFNNVDEDGRRRKYFMHWLGGVNWKQ